MPVVLLSRRVFAKLMYIGYLSVLCGTMLEVALRVWYDDPSYYWHHRYMFVSPHAFRNIDGLWTFTPNQEVREVAVYDLPNGTITFKPLSQVEYDCQFATNNLGFIGSADFSPGDRVVLVLGDSFAAGQGGCPWMHQVERAPTDIPLLNAGLMGTGFGHWDRVLTYVRRHGIVVEALVVIAISNDFKRPTWQWTSEQLACINGGVCAGPEYWHALAEDEVAGTLLRRARQRSINRNADRSVAWSVKEWLRFHSYLYKAVEPMILAFMPDKGELGVHQDALATLAKLKSSDVPFQVLLVPQRDEVARRRKNADSIMAESVLREQGVPYTWCELSPGDYMPLDGHPSPQGYRKLSGCFEQVLGQIEAWRPGASWRLSDPAVGRRVSMRVGSAIARSAACLGNCESLSQPASAPDRNSPFAVAVQMGGSTK